MNLFPQLTKISFLVFLVLCFGFTYIGKRPPAIFVLIVTTILPSFLNLWLIPGGFAWRNHPGKFRGPFCWPFLGLLPQMKSPIAHRKLGFLATSLGSKRLMPFSLGANTRVIISSHPDTAREILCGSSFSDRPVKESARTLMFERAIGFAPSGKYWRHLRRIAANHLFSPRRISSLEGVRQNLVDDMIKRVEFEMQYGGSGKVEIRPILQKGSLINVLESVFGSEFLGLEDGVKLGVMVEEGYELISEFNWADYIPFKFLDFGGVKKRCHKLAGEVKSLLERIIKERKKEGGFASKNDFLSVCLSLPKEDQLCDADLVAVLWEMIFRGTDTVALLLEWILARVVLHQDIQIKAQLEIDNCIGSGRNVQDSDIANLLYLQAIVKEVLRLHPPGPLLSWARLAIHDVHVDKFFVPAGTTAMVNMWAITHDPAIWKDPWTFRPERFIEEDVPIMGSDLRLAPFGSGRRVCPGRMLGLTTVQLWLARLLQEFKWIPISSSQQVDLSECLKLSLEMKKPLVCCAVKRAPSRVESQL
ncbi:OLC1v1028652C1 [Oldenlandia corymbosa var. corymbosa]|uniref:OLC1v1028652C1 n=1 Tax=Oldenlandia corymbosa var. corymbosa TaxID=529605 RepID=A0AAV1CC76_OLDCO|nr:OLC1v1028652C1 [Oldenlandia corymbosa var. corymbosa]